MTITKASAKVAAVATGLAMATSMLSLAPLAHAQTTPATCSVGTMNLTIGSTGAAVICLQTTLVAGGYLTMPAGVAMGYFGGLTQAAVAKWQVAKGIAPAAGYFGPISRAAFMPVAGGPATGCATKFDPNTGLPCVPGTPTTPTGPLAGTDGSINDVTKLGSFDNEEVSEGNEDVKIFGADIEASADGDIALKSVKVSFDPTGNSASDNLDDYLDTVTVWLGSNKVGSADADEFSQASDDVYSKTISLSGNTVIKADDVAKLYITVDAVSNIDSGDISGDSWTVGLQNIRFVDGSGVFTTDDSTGDLGSSTITITSAGTGGVAISFVSFSTSADTELKISTLSDSPDAGIVIADNSSNTDDVVLLKGKLKLDGSADVLIDSFPVTFTATNNGGSANGVDDIAGSVTLKLGGETYTETVTVTAALAGSVTFDNLDFAMDAGDSVNFEVLADVNDIDGVIFVAGATLKADVTASNRNSIDVENSEGTQLADSNEKSGTATGEAQEFRTNGIMLTLISVDATNSAPGTSSNDDQGTFKIKYKIAAIGDNVYVSSLASATTSGVTSGKTSIGIDRAGTATVGGVSVALSNITDSDLTSVGNYLIEEGSDETFELTATVKLPTAGAAGLYKAVLRGVRWGTTDVYPLTNTYTSNLDAFKTSYLGLN